jgi:hypothetical protein
MKRIYFLMLMTMLFNIAADAQRNVPAELERRIAGKTKVVDIMREVNAYYDNGRANISQNANDDDDFEGNDYDWWKKWEYWAVRRLMPNGDIANHRALNNQALAETEARWGNQLQFARTSLRANNAFANESNPAAARDNNANRSFGDWTSIGPFDGGTVVNTQTPATEFADIVGVARMDRIAFHPTNANIMYTGSPSGGVYKTTNAGGSWTAIGDGLPSGVACIGVAPSNGNVVYVFTGDGDSHYSGTLVFSINLSPASDGLFKSVDGGDTWTKCTNMYTGLGDIVGHQISISQSNSNYLFVATDKGLYRTIDGGNSWTQVRTGNQWDVEFRPYDDSTVYTSTATGVDRSIAGGRVGTWTASTFNFSPSSNRIDLAVRRNNTSAISTYVYALAGDAFTGSFAGIFLSTDLGVNFTRQSNTPNILGNSTTGADGSDQTRYDLGICVKPTDVTTIVTAGLCVWRGVGTSGATMQFSSTYRERNGTAAQFIHPDVHDVQYNPVNNNLYAATDGGVYRSTDDGATWTNISTGLVASQIYHMHMKDADGDGDMDGIEAIAGAQDNGIKYRNSSGSWVHYYCCDGYDGILKGSQGNYIVANYNNGWNRSSNGGTTLTSLGTTTFFTPFAIDYDNDDTMYAANSSLRRSFDGFVTNTTLGTDVNNFVTTCPSNNARLYGSSSTRTNLRISEDRGSTWTTISTNPGWPAGGLIVTDAKPWPTNSVEVYATFGGYSAGNKVFRTLDAGLTWTNYSGSLPNVPVHSVATSPEGVYAGTEIGVFFRADGAADWTPFYTGMPAAIVTDLWVNENGFVYASTFGRGAWIATRWAACEANISVTGALDGDHFYESNISTTMTAKSQSGNNTTILAKSNGFVDLKDGFEMKNGTEFKAYIGPCNTGGIPTGLRSNGATIVEYDDKDQAKNRKQNSVYYHLAADGIEVNMPEDGVLDIIVQNAETQKLTQVLQQHKLSKGMYKIVIGEGRFSGNVKLNGVAIPQL